MEDKDIRELLLKLKNENLNNDEKLDIKGLILNDYIGYINELTDKYLKVEDDREDLLQEIYLAFLNLIDNFDISKKIKFDDFITKSLDNRAKEIAKSLYTEDSFTDEIAKTLNKILDSEESFYKTYKRYPLDAELSEILDLDLSMIKEYKGYAIEILDEDKNNLDLLKLPLSAIVNKVREVENNTLITDDMETLKLCLDILSEKEKDIIEKYYGINGIKLDLNEIAREYNITKERARQIVTLATNKLKREME